MKSRLLTFLFALLLLLGSAVPALAQDREQEVRELLLERDREIKTVLEGQESLSEEERSALKELINDVIDFEAMAQTALGPHWSDLSSDERTEFVNVFSEVVRAQSLSDLEPYRADVTYETIDVNGDSAHVVTTAVYQGTPMSVEYDLAYEDGEWRAHDIILDDVSTAESYARSFQTVIRKRGFDTLMESLRKKRDQVTSNA